VKKAYPGTISSVILSVVVVMMLLMPFYVATHREKLRTGEGGYEFNERIWDIDSDDDFDNTWDDVNSFLLPCYTHWTANMHEQGVGAFTYYYPQLITPKQHVFKHSEMHISDVDIGDGPVNGYGHAISRYHTSYPPNSPDCGQDIFIALTLTVGEILEMDITGIDIFISFPGTTVEGDLIIAPRNAAMYFDSACNYWIYPFSKTDFYVGEVNHIEIDVDDLLKLNTYDRDDKMFIWMRIFSYHSDTGGNPTGGNLINGGDVYFDMQMYYIEEIKISTIDYMGIAMIGGGLFMGFCSILMLPTITFRSVIGRIVGKGGE